MSVWSATQEAIYARLVADAGVHALVADRIYDGVPEDPAFPYVGFGPSDLVTDDAECIDGFVETLQLDVWSSDQSRLWIAKDICMAVRDALHETDLTLSDGAASMVYVTGLRVMPSPDGIIAHGIVTLRIGIEV